MQEGRVDAIFIGSRAAAEPQPVERARAVAGRGLEGDRYFAASGTFSDTPGSGRDLTLIEAEVLDQLLRDGTELSPAAARRNVLTCGVALNDLVDRRFTIGEVECVGRRLCEPCAHLETVTRAGVLKALVNRGGLRADIVRDGEIAVGDAVRELGD